MLVLGMTLHILLTPDVMAKEIYPVMYLQDVQCSYKSLKLDLICHLSHSLAVHSLPTITVIELRTLYTEQHPLPSPQPLYSQTGKSGSSSLIAAILRSSTFWGNKRSRFRHAICACTCSSLTNPCSLLCLWGLNSRCLWNPCESLNWWLTLGVISTNLILSGSTKTVPAWRCDFLSDVYSGTCGWSFLFMIYAESDAMASTWPTVV